MKFATCRIGNKAAGRAHLLQPMCSISAAFMLRNAVFAAGSPQLPQDIAS